MFNLIFLLKIFGWNTIEYTDIILLRSPLNRSYALVYPKNYKEQLIL